MTYGQWDAIEWQGPFHDALEFFRIKSGILIQIMNEGMQLLIEDQVANRFTDFVKAIIGIADADKVWHTMTEITINEVLLCGTCFFGGVEAPVGSGFEPFKSRESKQIWIDCGERFQMERAHVQDYPWQSDAYLIYFVPRICLGTGMVISSLSSSLPCLLSLRFCLLLTGPYGPHAVSHPVYENPDFNLREQDPIPRGEPVLKPLKNECYTFFRDPEIGPKFYGLFVFVSALY